MIANRSTTRRQGRCRIRLFLTAPFRQIVVYADHRPRRFELVRHGFDQPLVEFARIGILAYDDPARRAGLGEGDMPNLAAPVVQTMRRIERTQGFFDAIDARRELGMARNAAPDLIECFAADLFRDLAESV